jgi:hypothetical protein
MFDPRSFFPAQEAAYNLPLTGSGTESGLIDTLLADDLDGPLPYGALVPGPGGKPILGIAGTRDGEEWILDFDFLPVDTPLGAMSRGIWQTVRSWRWLSGKPLNAYEIGGVCGHSRGGPLAITLSAILGIPAVVFACPRLVSADVLNKANVLSHVWVEGDIVPLAAPGYQSIPNTVSISPAPGVPIFSVRAHHIFPNYEAAINACFTN